MTRQAAAFPCRKSQMAFFQERLIIKETPESGPLRVLEQLAGLQAEFLWLLMVKGLGHIYGCYRMTISQAVSHRCA